MWQIKKHYGHELGLSACFRQWRADSHCRHLHGYALAFTFTFECETLNDKQWVVDFGGLAGLKQRLAHAFDHRLCVAEDDPCLIHFLNLSGEDCANPIVLPHVGCERFAEYAFGLAQEELEKLSVNPRVRLISCECAEHGANSAVYIP